jgi:hypothetical protein
VDRLNQKNACHNFMKAIIAAVLIAASGVFAEDVFFYDMTSSGYAPSLKGHVGVLRMEIKNALKIADEHGRDPAIVNNNPDIQRAIWWLVKDYGFTQKQIDREFQIAVNEYNEEKYRAARMRELEEQLWREAGL